MNSATTNPGPSPSDPSKISFDARCFVQVGERVEYTVCMSAPSYPKRFDSREAAENYARITRRTVTTTVKPIMKRVSWT